jgi:acetate kinase
MSSRRVLVVNAGSTSLKLHLVEGEESSPVETFVECEAVGHRVVHGGRRFVEPVVIDDEVTTALRALIPLAPLHNAPALAAIEDARQALPDVPHVAVFDTAFHRTMPEEATRYAVPQRWFEWGVQRYGFHGLSVEWAASQVRVPRLVVCHLGGGSSVTAVLDGRSVETTMGFSPLEGVPMTTRSGSVDPGAVLYLMRERGLSVDELDHALEHDSGLAALSGTSGDVRELADDSLALAVYVHRVAAAVAASAAALGGLDALVFTGGIGEHSPLVRDRVCERLRFLDPFDVHVIRAREELVIARAVRGAL